MMIKDTYMSHPCGNCPFRKDCHKGWLGEKRTEEISEADSFVCHKDNSKQCAGHLIVCEDVSLFQRFAKMFGIDLKMKGKEKLFDSKKDFIKHHKN